MELKQYIAVLRRRWLPAVLVPILVAIVVVIQVFGTEPSYSASAQLAVTRVPQQANIEEFRYNEYYLFLSSEFFIDDLVEIVRGNVFAEDVRDRLLDEYGLDLSAGFVQEAISSERRHRILTLDVTTDDPDQTVMVARAAASILNESAGRYFGFQGEEREALIQPVELPESAGSTRTSDQIFWALQLVLALFAGIVLAYFIDYLDDGLYTAEMVEHTLGVDVVAEVPRGRGA